MTIDPTETSHWLLQGEAIVVDASAKSVPESLSNEKINEKYVKGEIRIVTEQARYPIVTVSNFVDDTQYRIAPEYQRRHRWDKSRKSRLIESLIMNVPIPPIFLYEYDYSKYEVMDGLQRLTAIYDFYHDKFALEGLTEWSELNGKTYSELPDKVREGVDRRYLSSVILLKETAKDEAEALRLKQLVFERINSGGVKLEAQETRNAIFDGAMNQLCIKLSRNKALCRLWGIPEPEDEEIAGGPPSNARVEHDEFRKMGDVELVLRFFAYRQKHKLQQSGQSLKDYLDDFLRYGNAFSSETLGGMRDVFEQTISFVEEIFADRAFFLYRKRTLNNQDYWSWLERPTTTVYDPLMFVMSNHLGDRETIVRKKANIELNIEAFYRDNYAVFEGRNVNTSALQQREAKLDEFISSFV